MKRAGMLSVCLAVLFLLACVAAGATAAPNGYLTGRMFHYETNGYEAEEAFPIVRLQVNGAEVNGEVAGFVQNGRTMAPLRLLAEELGATVEWVQDAAQVVVTQNGKTIVLMLGSALAEVNGESVPLPDGVPAGTILYEGQGYTMVPLRFFSETLGCTVTWVQENYTASISEAGYIDALTDGLIEPKEPEKYLIALDAGHGGKWSGAYYENTAEKDLNLAITLKLDEILRALGYGTTLTRSEDVNIELLDRAKWANRAKADIFVSIHCNAAENAPNFQGLYVYHYPKSGEGQALAQSIQTAACQFTGAVDRNINSANFSVLRNTQMPAVLVESGFMSCHEELERLKDSAYQEKMAKGIAQGIVRYLNAQE